MQSQMPLVEQKQVLIGLRREQLDQLPWGIVKVNKDGVFTYGNRKMCEMAGLDTIEGTNMNDLVLDDDLAVVRKHLESRFTHGEADEYRVRLKRGGGIPVLIQALPEADERGQIVGSIGIVREVMLEEVTRRVHDAIEGL